VGRFSEDSPSGMKRDEFSFFKLAILQIISHYIFQYVLNLLVKEVRERIGANIRNSYGSMQVLDMNRSVELTGDHGIYTDVNILEEITGRRRLEISDFLQNDELLQNLEIEDSTENFNRFGLSDILVPRVPGLEAVQKHRRLIVLGKPGAGKTTFLKYLAIQCIEGEFQEQRVPIFITLKNFAEVERKPSLLDFIVDFFSGFDIESEPICELLKQGRFLILLDGLDEVREEDTKRVLRQIDKFADQFFLSDEFKYNQSLFLREKTKKQKDLDRWKKISVKYKSSRNIPKRPDLSDYPNISRSADQGLELLSRRYPNSNHSNQFVITCRIAAKEYSFAHFTEVEIADFNWTQITKFVRNWFRSDDVAKSERFIRKIQDNEPVKDLGSSPLLLTLLCLVFGATGDFPANRSELYKEGLDVLLKKWDAKRNIERDQIYKGLSVRRKEDLLSQIALTAFVQKEYFMKQDILEEYVTQFIRNLPDANSSPESLRLDSEAILKSIEAQHGLIIERARGIYSFSHLTFQEYFTAKEIVANSAYDDLTNHVAEKRWREVFLLTAGMMRNAGDFIHLMKQKIDLIVSKDKKIEEFLLWIHEKTAVYPSSRGAAARVIYFLQSTSSSNFFDFDINLIYALDRYTSARVKSLSNSCLEMYECFSLFAAFGANCAPEMPVFIKFIRLCQIICKILSADCEIVFNSSLLQGLKDLQKRLPEASHEDFQPLKEWMKSDGGSWIEEARRIVRVYDDIPSWKFTASQTKLLQQYYDSNKLLVDCMSSDCYTNKEVREAVVNKLFVPSVEIEAK
jgi:NACHT domain